VQFLCNCFAKFGSRPSKGSLLPGVLQNDFLRSKKAKVARHGASRFGQTCIPGRSRLSSLGALLGD